MAQEIAETDPPDESATEPASVDPDQLFYLSMAAEGSLAAYLVGGVFNTVLYYPSFWFLTAFVMILKKIALGAHDDHPAHY